MKTKRYKLILEDESRIERVAQVRLSVWRVVLVALGMLLLAVGVSVCLIMFTPLRQMLPGYMKEAQRMLTESSVLRVDSLREVYSRNEAYIQNLLTVLDTERNPGDTMSKLPAPAMVTDSLMAATPGERKFVTSYNNRERYNVSVLSPLAAQGMAFVPVSRRSVISADSVGGARIVLAAGEGVACIADGRVIDVGNTLGDGGTVVIQHGRGFVSRYTRLGRVVVNRGDEVLASQIIALQRPGSGRDASQVGLELWRNGDALKPGEYLGK